MLHSDSVISFCTLATFLPFFSCSCYFIFAKILPCRLHATAHEQLFIFVILLFLFFAEILPCRLHATAHEQLPRNQLSRKCPWFRRHRSPLSVETRDPFSTADAGFPLPAAADLRCRSLRRVRPFQQAADAIAYALLDAARTPAYSLVPFPVSPHRSRKLPG